MCYKCCTLDHFDRYYSIWKRNNSDKVKELKKNQVLDRKMQKRTTDEIVRKTLATMGNTSSGESKDESEIIKISLH